MWIRSRFWGCFWTLSGESATEYAGANMIKRVLNEEKTGLCEVGCGLGLPAPCAPRPSTLGGPAAPAAAENGRIGGGLSAPLILGGEEAPLLPS